MKKIILPISMMLIAFLASSFSIDAQETVTVAKVGGAEISLDKEIVIELESSHLPHLRANLNSTLRLLQASYETINAVKI